MSQYITIDNKLQGGLKDYTRYLKDADQFYSHENNQPSKFSFVLQDIGDEDFVIPTRGSYVSFWDDRFESRDEGVPDGLLFTGYVSDEPEPHFLGTGNNGVSVWEYRVTATSEEYLPQIKNLPQKVYVNKTRGFIIRDLLAEMFQNADVPPLDTSGVRDGGIERLYQTDPVKKFADMVAEFAKADAYRYRVLDGKIFYEPEAEMLPGSSDTTLKLVIDDEDPRFTPMNLNLERVATSIVNDVTVLGDKEPTTLVGESYVSDGYQGEYQLLTEPYGVLEQVLVEDDLTAPSFDSGLWQEEDDDLALTGEGDGSYLQMFEGAFNIVGGAGTAEAPEVWLRSRRGIELSGIIHFRDGEIYFPPSPSGTGLVGGLFSDESMKQSACFSGWIVDADASQLKVVVDGEVVLSFDITINSSIHYILRRRFEFDLPTGPSTVHRGPRETDIVFGEEEVLINNCWVTYSIDQIDYTDPQDLIVQKQELYTARIENVPEFVIYAPIVSYDLHMVMNFVKVHRPQQVRLQIDGVTVPVGDFIDGGLATIEVGEDGKSKLHWYSIPTSTPETPDPIITPSVTPFAEWNLNDGGTHILDSGNSGGYPMTQSGPISLTPGPTSGISQGRSFPGGGASILGPVTGGLSFNAPSTSGFPIPVSITGFVKTTSANGPIFSYMNLAYGYTAAYVQNGRIALRAPSPEVVVSGATAVNDGSWHHFAIVHDAAPFTPGETKIYLDGVLDGSGSQHIVSPISGFPWAIGYDNARWDSLGSVFIETWFSGSLAKIALWNMALSASTIDGLYRTTQNPGGAAPPPAYNPQTGVTIPPQGSRVEIQYYRAEQARARVKSLDSIQSERAKFGDDGVRQLTVLPDDVFPVPRTSAECQFLAQALLADRASFRYEGSYQFPTGENDITRLDIMPAPGDLIPVFATLPNGELIDTNLHCTSVDVSFGGLGAYDITLGFGPRSRFEEAQRKLLLARKSSIEMPEIRDNDTLIAEVLNTTGYAIPPSPRDVLVSQVTPLTFTVNMNPLREAAVGGYGAGGGTEVNGDLPEGVVGYEVRRGDTGWGQGNYVARVASATFALNRGTRDRAYFIRPFNAQNVYSRTSALVRVISPLSNNLVATNLDGDISGTTIRLFIPIDRNPDIGGWLIQKDNSDGAVLYQGNGIDHRVIVSGAQPLVESGRFTLMLPVSTGAYTVRVLVYNLLGEFGPETLFTITRAAPTV